MFKSIFKQPKTNAISQQKKAAINNVNEPSEADLVTLELLQAAETYSVLVLMLPRLVWELKQRLTEIDQELESITTKLQQLYNRRNDILAASRQPMVKKEPAATIPPDSIQPASKAKTEPVTAVMSQNKEGVAA